MRLLNTKSLKLEYFAGDEVPKYAILSHRWEAEEILFRDVQTRKWPQKKGADKVKRACSQAKDDGFEHIWIDTCCIDKSSSVELSEAINSMFSWYHDSQVCYAYLFDVPTGKTGAFAKSEWFTRGWTLQELIAPSKVQFFDSQWRMIGDRLSLLDSIVKVTAIDRRVLDRGRNHRLCPAHVLRSSGFMMSCYCELGNKYPNFRDLLSSFSVARRLSWASTRVTTRVEDRAYALLGLFNVNMPLLYGEGTKAFRRLQEEIIRHSNDQSVLAGQAQHSVDLDLGNRGIEKSQFDATVDAMDHLFPPHPRAFRGAGNLERPIASSEYLSMTLTNRCLNIDLHVCPCWWKPKNRYQPKTGWLGILDCVYSDDYLSRPAIAVDRVSSTGDNRPVLTRTQTYGRTLIRISPGAQPNSNGDVEFSEKGLTVWFNPSHIEKMNIDLLLHPPAETHATRKPAIRINPIIGGREGMAYQIRTWFPDLETTPDGNIRDAPFILDNLQAIKGGLPGLLAIDDGSNHGFFVAYGFSVYNISDPDVLDSLTPPKYVPWCRLLAWHQVVPGREFAPADDESAITNLQEDMARFNYTMENGLPVSNDETQPHDSMDWPGRPDIQCQVAATPSTFLGQTVYELKISVWRVYRQEPVGYQESGGYQEPKVQVKASENPSPRSVWRRLHRA